MTKPLPPADSPALLLRDLSKHYPGAAAASLDGVDLCVPQGQLVGLIGHNGAGKSTLFKLVLGLITPSRGEVQVLGCPVKGRDFRAVRRGLGYLPENLVLWDNLSGLETLQLFARLKDAPLAQCDALLAQVGLEEAARRPVREYSKGMRQRLGFAQALLGEPRLLLLDEPTTGLDPQATRDFYAQLEQQRARGVTVLISSHVLAELQQRVDALAMLANGRLCAQGSVQALREGSSRPLSVTLQGDAARLAQLAQELVSELPSLSARALPDGGLLLQCPRVLKMVLLTRLGQAGRDGGLSDLQLQEPTLEDLYFDLREAA